jgi:rhodanese-related sulfurtransferase
MKNVLLAVVVTALSSSAALAQSPDRLDTPAKLATDAARVLTRAEFDALLEHPEHLLIVDVRRPDEVTSIGGFGVYLSVQPADVEKNLALIPRERTIVAVSNHAKRAIRVANVLAANGFEVAGTLGAQDYEEAGGALVKIAPRQAAAPTTK